MNPFDPSAMCPKCGNKVVSILYHTDARSLYCAATTYEEHLERVCQRCHFAWTEAPLDRQEEEKP